MPFANENEIEEELDNDDLVVDFKNYENIGVDNRGLNIVHLNVNGLRSKLDYLKIVVNKNRFDILCLNETKIDGSIADSDIELPGYKSYRQDRNLHGGGTIIYAAQYLDTRKLCRLSRKDHESVWIELKQKKCKPIYICAIYRPPTLNDLTKQVLKDALTISLLAFIICLKIY